MSEKTTVKVGDLPIPLSEVPTTNIGTLARLETEFKLGPKDLTEGAGFNYQAKMVLWTLQQKFPEVTEDGVLALDLPDFLALIGRMNAAEVPEGL